MSVPIRIILVDDHLVVRSGLRRLLEQSDDLEVIAEADSGEQAYQIFGEHLPDVLVMDMSMPGMGGLEAVRRILARYPAARIVIFSMHENATFATQALTAGARGYVAKSGAADDLVRGIREVNAGRSYLSASIAQKIALQSLSGEEDPIKRLSAREFEVFRLLAEGGAIEVIADTLNISQKTVANYQTMLKQKLGINSPVELVRLAIRYGVIQG
ncbi:response regulator [Methyloradius palustris]|uniref:DNA-binding response regulator n=1 Tax=Methyloradius palustris TaxID=2778876 RepID=A0A8D5JRN8_9PROT|nr:response regulator transcription factor [Methyloradius palustris]BCM25661.1 DNA-binding response regulator [Methyloradius palustris]